MAPPLKTLVQTVGSLPRFLLVPALQDQPLHRAHGRPRRGGYYAPSMVAHALGLVRVKGRIVIVHRSVSEVPKVFLWNTSTMMRNGA